MQRLLVNLPFIDCDSKPPQTWISQRRPGMNSSGITKRKPEILNRHVKKPMRSISIIRLWMCRDRIIFRRARPRVSMTITPRVKKSKKEGSQLQAGNRIINRAQRINHLRNRKEPLKKTKKKILFSTSADSFAILCIKYFNLSIFF